MSQQNQPKLKKTTLFKVFIDVHREIEWLNEMSKKGYHLVARYVFYYVFDVAPSHCYQYQVVLRTLHEGEAEHRDYSEFLSEMDIEISCKYSNYVYLRREGEEPFEFFTAPADWRKQYFRHALANGAILLMTILYMISMKNRNWPGAALIEVQGMFKLTFSALITSAFVVISGLGLKYYLLQWFSEGERDNKIQ